MSRMGGQPLVVLSDESQRTSGRDAQAMNITAGKAVATAIRTTLGPKGMDKMLVDSTGDALVTNDGVTILREMDIEHPTANMIVDVAKTQETEVGDGTTTAVVLAGQLLAKAEELLEQEVHATTVARGYRQAAQQIPELLEELVTDVDASDREYLERIATTAMTGKGAEHEKDHLADLIVTAIQIIADDDLIDLDHIDVKSLVGGAVGDTELIEGVVVEKKKVHQEMPMIVEDATVALLDGEIDTKETEIDAEVNVSDPDELQEFLDEEERQFREQVDRLGELGVDVLFTTENIDDGPRHMMANAGILAARRIDDDEAERLARTTGAIRAGSIEALTEDHLGYAGTVAERETGDDTWIFVEDVEDPGAVTILLRGGTEHVVDEIERALEDSLGVVRTTVQDGRVVPGGGAPEISLALGLRDFADSVGGREQLAVEAFADALDVIPRTLAENAGHDPIDSLVELRAAHDGGASASGLDAYTGEIEDMLEAGVVEPWRVKTQAIDAATEAAVMILRIDDVISAGDLAVSDDDGGEEEEEGPPGGGMGGMGGMGGGMGGMM